jgi:phenylacetate-CoA ligase
LKQYKTLKYIKAAIRDKPAFLKVYPQIKQIISASEKWSLDQVNDFQLSKLKRLLVFANEQVPYYKKVFREAGFDPREFNSLLDLQRVPYLTKDIINEHKKEMVALNVDSRFLGYATTGGSTGIPMGFYTDHRTFGQLEWAYIVAQWERAGYSFGAKFIRLRGDVVSNIINGKKYWESDFFRNALVMSSYHMSDQTLHLYVDKIRDFSPEFIHAYPSSLQVLADFMKKYSIPPFHSIKSIFLGSENLFSWQRSLFEEVFNTRIFSWYGHTEQCCLAGECERSSLYHSYPTYGFVELVNENNEWCTLEDEPGEIIATGFINYFMPFIRYKTQDIGIYTGQKCVCQRNWKLIKRIEGRQQDYVIGKKGNKITLTGLIFAQHFQSFGKIRNLQLFQNVIGEVEVRIVENVKLENNEKLDLIHAMERASDHTLSVRIEVVPCISKTKNGKHQFIVQELKLVVPEKYFKRL